MLVIENDAIIQSIINKEVEFSECLIFFDNFESFLIKFNDTEYIEFLKFHNCKNIGGTYIRENIVDNGFPKCFIFINNSNSLLIQSFCLLHEIAHYENVKIENSIYNREDNEYYAFFNMGNKILYSDFNNSGKKQLIEYFIHQIEKKCNDHRGFYKNAARRIIKTDLWEECLESVKNFDDSLIFAA